MKAKAPLAAVALLAACQAFAQYSGSAASTSSTGGSYDWGQSQVQRMYQSPYARPSDAAAATAERKRLTEGRNDPEDRDAKGSSTASVKKPGGSGKLACMGMGMGLGSTMTGTSCQPGDHQGLSLSARAQQQGLQKH